MPRRWSRSLGKWRHLRNDRHLTQWLKLLRSDDQMVEAYVSFVICASWNTASTQSFDALENKCPYFQYSNVMEKGCYTSNRHYSTTAYLSNNSFFYFILAYNKVLDTKSCIFHFWQKSGHQQCKQSLMSFQDFYGNIRSRHGWMVSMAASYERGSGSQWETWHKTKQPKIHGF